LLSHEIYGNKYLLKNTPLKFYDENFHDKEPAKNLTGSLLLFFILFSD